jgi:thioredoxin 1
MRELTTANFKEFIEQKTTVLIEFTSATCMPCHAYFQTLSQLEPEYEGDVLFAAVNSKRCPEFFEQYEIDQVPTVLIFQNGVIRERIPHVQTKEKIRTILDELMV